MNRKSLSLMLPLALMLGLSGCGKSQAKSPDPAQQAKVIQTASPEVQKGWQLALAAAETNDFATAILTLRKLQSHANPTPEQQAAITARMNAINDQLAAAIQKGDPEATKAMQEIRDRWRSQ